MAEVSLPVYDTEGAEVGSYPLDPAEFAPRINKQLLHDAVVMYQANKRQGSFATKTRGQVRGTTRKMYRQKGTGHARAGSKRSGVRRGGGHIFAKSPRDFSYRLPRKAVQLAARMAILSKIQDDQIKVVSELPFEAPKTRRMTGILKALGIHGESVIVAVDGHDENIHKSARNIDRVSVSNAVDLNALNVLAPRYLLVTKAALDRIRERAAEQSSKKTPA
ncbi:MAG: 50S ribosomal protein L4, partial [Planctomycetales bacterium]